MHHLVMPSAQQHDGLTVVGVVPGGLFSVRASEDGTDGDLWMLNVR